MLKAEKKTYHIVNGQFYLDVLYEDTKTFGDIEGTRFLIDAIEVIKRRNTL